MPWERPRRTSQLDLSSLAGRLVSGALWQERPGRSLSPGRLVFWVARGRQETHPRAGLTLHVGHRPLFWKTFIIKYVKTSDTVRLLGETSNHGQAPPFWSGGSPRRGHTSSVSFLPAASPEVFRGERLGRKGTALLL